MKSSLWIIIALVTGIVGFLMGYGVSSFTGTRQPPAAAGHAARAPAGAPAEHAAAGGYAGAEKPKDAAPAGGYGAAEKPRDGAAPPAAGGQTADAKPKAAGY
jgi:hypothetical protein